jgi:hypothetical protein
MVAQEISIVEMLVESQAALHRMEHPDEPPWYFCSGYRRRIVALFGDDFFAQ